MAGATYNKSVKEGGRCCFECCRYNFNHERVRMSCLLDALKANNCTNNNVHQSHQRLRSQGLMAHNILNGTRHVRHHELMVHIALVTSVLSCNLQWSFLPPMHGAYGYAFQTQQVHSISHTKLTPGWVLIQVNFDPIQEIGLKVGGWVLFHETMVHKYCWLKLSLNTSLVRLSEFNTTSSGHNWINYKTYQSQTCLIPLWSQWNAYCVQLQCSKGAKSKCMTCTTQPSC